MKNTKIIVLLNILENLMSHSKNRLLNYDHHQRLDQEN